MGDRIKYIVTIEEDSEDWSAKTVRSASASNGGEPYLNATMEEVLAQAVEAHSATINGESAIHSLALAIDHHANIFEDEMGDIFERELAALIKIYLRSTGERLSKSDRISAYAAALKVFKDTYPETEFPDRLEERPGIRNVPSWIEQALGVDGAHHKQFYLQKLATVFGVKLPEGEQGIAP